MLLSWVCVLGVALMAQVPAGVPGDCNSDGVTNLGDWATFVALFSGPDSAAGPGASCIDFDADADVDLVDATLFAVIAGGVAPSGAPPTLDLSIKSGNQSAIIVPPGTQVEYAVSGELSPGDSAGLAFFGFDLVFDGGDMSPADAPAASPMTAFAVPDGVNNPAGFGGTLQAGSLVQVGGGQNVIANTVDNAPFPIGSVVTGVALQGSPQTLVTGSVAAPLTPGIYHLTASNVFGSVLAPGATAGPPWATESLQPGASADLTITVSGDPSVPAASDWCLVTMLLASLIIGALTFGRWHPSGNG